MAVQTGHDHELFLHKNAVIRDRVSKRRALRVGERVSSGEIEKQVVDQTKILASNRSLKGPEQTELLHGRFSWEKKTCCKVSS